MKLLILSVSGERQRGEAVRKRDMSPDWRPYPGAGVDRWSPTEAGGALCL